MEDALNKALNAGLQAALEEEEKGVNSENWRGKLADFCPELKVRKSADTTSSSSPSEASTLTVNDSDFYCNGMAKVLTNFNSHQRQTPPGQPRSFSARPKGFLKHFVEEIIHSIHSMFAIDKKNEGCFAHIDRICIVGGQQVVFYRPTSKKKKTYILVKLVNSSSSSPTSSSSANAKNNEIANEKSIGNGSSTSNLFGGAVINYNASSSSSSSPSSTSAPAPMNSSSNISNENHIYGIRSMGLFKSCFRFKFGIPRQGSVSPLTRGILALHNSIPPDSLQGLTDYSHVWLVFLFHHNNNIKHDTAFEVTEKKKNNRVDATGKTSKNTKNRSKDSKGQNSGSDANSGGEKRHMTDLVPDIFHSKVRPPRLGGEKVGVYATRTPHRLNPIGMSVAKLEGIDMERGLAYFSGVDLLHNTPIIDIKPYHPADVVPAQALSVPTWMHEAPVAPLKVEFTADALTQLVQSVNKPLEFYPPNAEMVMTAIKETLQLDPRTTANKKGGRTEFGFCLDNLNILFRVVKPEAAAASPPSPTTTVVGDEKEGEGEREGNANATKRRKLNTEGDKTKNTPTQSLSERTVAHVQVYRIEHVDLTQVDTSRSYIEMFGTV